MEGGGVSARLGSMHRDDDAVAWDVVHQDEADRPGAKREGERGRHPRLAAMRGASPICSSGEPAPRLGPELDRLRRHLLGGVRLQQRRATPPGAGFGGGGGGWGPRRSIHVHVPRRETARAAAQGQSVSQSPQGPCRRECVSESLRRSSERWR